MSFTKVLDTYEEVDDGSSIEAQTHNREFWAKKAAWTLDAADALLTIAREVIPDVALTYLKHYIAFGGKKNYVWLHKRSSGKSLVNFRVSDIHWEKVEELLSNSNIVPTRKKGSFLIVLDRQLIDSHREVIRDVLDLVKES